MILRLGMLIYAIIGYGVATCSLLYIMGFLADFGVPKGISDGSETNLWMAVLINFSVIGIFGLHHSITARTSFKRWWTKFVPSPIERSTYLYMTAIMTALVVHVWRPIPITIWHIESENGVAIMSFIYISIWLMMSASTFHFGHFGFFGLTQAWQNFRNSKPKPSNMTARYLYALVRHPISLGWMTAPLVTPHLTVGHLVFAGATISYILIATPFEEADLIDDIGERYVKYRQFVPAFIPFLQPKRTKRNTA